VHFIKPQLATLYDNVPTGKWLYEVKFDGYRMQVNREHGTSRFFTRSGLDWLRKFSFIGAGMEKLPPDIIIDGEVVSVEPNGRSNFSQLQDDIKRGRQDRMTFYAFDLLYLADEDLRMLPQLERKARLKKVLNKKIPGINYSEHHTDGAGNARPCLRIESGRAHSEATGCPISVGAERELAQAEVHPDRPIPDRGLRTCKRGARSWCPESGHKGSEVRREGGNRLYRQSLALAAQGA